MLSERLASLAARLDDYREDGMELSPIGVAAVHALLADLADDAAILEQNTRPVAPMGGMGPMPIPEGENVVRLETAR